MFTHHSSSDKEPQQSNDDLWFSENPSRVFRSRKPLPNELLDFGVKDIGHPCWLIVKRQAYSEYAIMIVNSPLALPDIEGFLRAFFDAALSNKEHATNIDFVQQLGRVDIQDSQSI